MSDIGPDENKDEFECSYCEFKGSNETDLIHHIGIHLYSNNVIDDALNIIPWNSTIVNDSIKELDTDFNLQNKINSGKETYCDTNLTDTPEMNDLVASKSIVKKERILYEDISAAEIGNKKVKLELIDIKYEDITYSSSPNQIDELYNIQQSQTYKKEHINGMEEMPVAENNNNVNIFTADKDLSDKKIFDVSKLLTCQNKPLQNDMDVKSLTKGLSPSERPFHVEVEVHNPGVYIPPGWIRAVDMGYRFYKGQMMYDCYYFTDLGTKLCSKEDAHDYIITNSIANVDIEKLIFSVTLKTKKPVQPMLEMDVDNTRIYIPDGWQRELSERIISISPKKFHINYVSPEGKRFWSKSDVYAYLLHSDSTKRIDVEEMNFTVEDQSILAGKDKDFNDLFEVRKIIKKPKSWNLYVCKLCSNSFNIKCKAYSHVSTHIQQLRDEYTRNNDLQIKYDYYKCTVCHVILMKIQDLQIHMKSHCCEQISSNIVGVRKLGRIKFINYCEVCTFSCSIYYETLKHLKGHSADEIAAADKYKYHKYTNESELSDEYILCPVYKYEPKVMN
ncbi:unnamed protein product [Meganyctiphanes norvegica]|uniref:MBD domain-containing protein n=1 Tax=Meganyctiphanes norvegica TaxID=48144 RepID=A0AAV2RY03_MEGNR